MLSFCGYDRALIDANGRIKLSPRVIKDFSENDGNDVVLHCLPEGALAIYPENIYLQMRKNEPNLTEKASSSVVFRRIIRRFGALSRSEKITAQGRITIPTPYREYADIHPGNDVVVVGCEIGVEIWNAKRWAEELDRMNDHFRKKGEREMSDDLLAEHID
jgi:DNA-binding transcriptional regulator/RsmH inhibitor MraZ